MRFDNAEAISDWRLCAGCGACEYACAEGRIRLHDIEGDGIRPVVEGGCDGCARDCVAVCPGIEATSPRPPYGALPAMRRGWGPVLGVWEGYAADPEIRHEGSSGGAATAVALFAIEYLGMHGALHVGADPERPLANRAYLSRDRGSLLSRAGSRYSPAAPCSSLGLIEEAPSPCVFIGKPCDVTALKKAGALRGAVKRNTGLAISIFCAGTPSALGTVELLKRLRVTPEKARSIRYRGHGWPGELLASTEDGEARASYKEAWGFLQGFRPLRCHLCPDGTGESADISCGDPWYRNIERDEPGRSLIVARTPLGRRVIEAAIDKGYLKAEMSEPELLERSQGNLLAKRGSVWGRSVALRLLGAPAPRFPGFSLFLNWLELPAWMKLRSVGGTVRRALERGYLRKRQTRELVTSRDQASRAARPGTRK